MCSLTVFRPAFHPHPSLSLEGRGLKRRLLTPGVFVTHMFRQAASAILEAVFHIRSSDS
jgi:hypothetical protein